MSSSGGFTCHFYRTQQSRLFLQRFPTSLTQSPRPASALASPADWAHPASPETMQSSNCRPQNTPRPSAATTGPPRDRHPCFVLPKSTPTHPAFWSYFLSASSRSSLSLPDSGTRPPVRARGSPIRPAAQVPARRECHSSSSPSAIPSRLRAPPTESPPVAERTKPAATGRWPRPSRPLSQITTALRALASTWHTSAQTSHWLRHFCGILRAGNTAGSHPVD